MCWVEVNLGKDEHQSQRMNRTVDDRFSLASPE